MKRAFLSASLLLLVIATLKGLNTSSDSSAPKDNFFDEIYYKKVIKCEVVD